MPDLADVKPKSVEARERCMELGEKIGELRGVPREKRTEEQNAELKATTTELLAANAEFEMYRSTERYDMDFAKWEAEVKAAEERAKKGKGPDAALDDLTDRRSRSFADLVVENEDYKRWAEGNSNERMPILELRGSLHNEYRTLLDSTEGGNGPFSLRPVGQPIPPTPRQMNFFIRDLVPTTQTGLAAVPYVREYNPATNETGATGVAEGADKPEVTMQFEDDTAVVKKLAAWVPATMEILQDAPTLRGYIEQRLRYMLMVREQAQILNGAGTGAQLKGILQFSGVQTAGATNNDIWVDFATAIGKVELVDGDVNGVVMNPTDYWDQVATRRSTWFDGNSANAGGSPFAGPPGTVWGEPVVRTRAVDSLTAVVGDWRGAMIFDRMQTIIRQSDSHDDYFVKNKVAILCEERLALAVFRPDFFVNVTLDITA